MGSLAAKNVGSAITGLDYASAESDLQRALTQTDTDPVDAITSVYSIVESVCKCILAEMGRDYTSKQGIRFSDGCPQAPAPVVGTR